MRPRLVALLALMLALAASPHLPGHQGFAFAKGDGGGDGGGGGGGGSGGGGSSGHGGDGGDGGDGGGDHSGGESSGGDSSGGESSGGDDSGGESSGGDDSGGDDSGGDDSGGDDSGGDDSGDDSSGSNGSGHAGDSAGRHIGRELTVVGATLSADALRPFNVVVIEERDLRSLGLHIIRLRTLPPISTEETLAALRLAFPDALVSRNHLYRPEKSDGPSGTPASPGLSNWHRRLTHWSEEAAACARGRAIGVIDTMLLKGEADLAGIDIESRTTTDAGYEASLDAHGSYVVSLLAGPNIGVVPGARVFHAAAVEGVGRGVYASATSIATALDWMVGNRVAVVNVSLAGPDNPLLHRAIQIAATHGTLLVAPVGNDGPSADTAYPAAYPEVVAITATDRLNRVWQGASKVPDPAIAAPGAGLHIGRATVSGTSYASPLAAGALLTALTENDTGDPRQRLLSRTSATDRTGIGLVQFDPGCFRD
ncbi:S8 family serine peptidase [Zavarzinia sp.]|uniref:S8 family serine peptidase n=1 Tax=Zavarzinia sp. TaxID=2027920 RepID=UPI003BB4C06C